MGKIVLKNGKEIIIRKANIDDVEKLVQYKTLISSESDFLTFGKNEIEITAESEQQGIESTNNKDNSIMIVALLDGEIVGSIVFRGGKRIRIKHVGEMGVTIRKSYWGLGIGTYLLEFLIEWAKKTGIVKKINLIVRADNKNAIKLYKKFNFKNEGIITRAFYINEEFYNAISMGLLID